jgi:hypothetical protein
VSEGLSIGSDIVIELPVLGEDSGGQVNGVRVLAADIGVCVRIRNGHVEMGRGVGFTATDDDIAFSGLGSIK